MNQLILISINRLVLKPFHCALHVKCARQRPITLHVRIHTNIRIHVPFFHRCSLRISTILNLNRYVATGAHCAVFKLLLCEFILYRLVKIIIDFF